jgi:hypothetical protein
MKKTSKKSKKEHNLRDNKQRHSITQALPNNLCMMTLTRFFNYRYKSTEQNCHKNKKRDLH